jgi:3-deoxy-7-phosphoheptulonate synthase
MKYRTEDLRIREIREVISPAQLHEIYPLNDAAARTVYEARSAVHEILNGRDDRLIVIIGPCSIHDPLAARDYCARLQKERERLGADLLLIMRVYFEKPRTTVGWKGLINDPDLDGSFQINKGLRLARELLVHVNSAGVPAAVEFLDLVTPQYVADCVSWGAIGARTTESQVHRELASGLSCPVGFKNGTDGSLGIAVDAVRAARVPHNFLSLTRNGHSAIFSTSGNEDCHVILRGGRSPNFSAAHVNDAAKVLESAGLPARLMIDFSHANSGKNPLRQRDVAEDVAGQIAHGDTRIIGVMVESHIKAGRQELKSGTPPEYGQSITDACLGWEDSIAMLDALADAVRKRRGATAKAAI